MLKWERTKAHFADMWELIEENQQRIWTKRRTLSFLFLDGIASIDLGYEQGFVKVCLNPYLGTPSKKNPGYFMTSCKIHLTPTHPT